MLRKSQPITFFIFYILAFTACQKSDKHIENLNLTFSKVKEISINFRDTELPDLHHIQRIDSCRLVSFNNNHQELIIFNYCDPNQEKKIIKLPQDGPNFLGQVDGVYYINKDSIFLSSDTELTVNLVDSNLSILNSWSFEENYLPNEYIIKNSSSYYSVIVAFLPGIINYPFEYNSNNKSLFLSILCISNLSGYQEFETVYNSPNILEIPLNHEEERAFYGKWPESYQKNKIPYNPMVNFAISIQGNPVINYHYDDYIYDTSTEKFFIAKSNFSNYDFSLFNKDDLQTNSEMEIKAYTLDESYVDIHYDPYENVYYRIFKQVQLDSNIPGEKPLKTDAEWSIIVLDQNFMILGEVKFEKEKYNFLKIIPTKDGILIAENRNKNTTKENILYFDLIKINY